jgi:hypothetical protein
MTRDRTALIASYGNDPTERLPTVLMTPASSKASREPPDDVLCLFEASPWDKRQPLLFSYHNTAAKVGKIMRRHPDNSEPSDTHGR